jgi:hypothetical protein
MQDTWMERLSGYLDGEMDKSERASMEAHLEECADCAAALEDLKKVRERALTLSDMPVPPELWSRIETAIAAGPGVSAGPPRVTRLSTAAGGRFAFSLPELLAACLAVAIVSGSAVYAVVRHQAPATKTERVAAIQAPEPRTSPLAPSERALPTDGPVNERASAPSPVAYAPAVRTDAGVVTSGPTAETPHEVAIAELRKVLMSKRNQLDPATIRTLEANLAIIDIAIDQARRALAADSANTYVKEHLADTMRRKVELLQRATMLASASNSEGTR